MTDDADSRSMSVPRSQSLALRSGNALVTRGLQDIAQFGNRARAKELVELGDKCCDYATREYNEAIAYYTEAIRLDPKDAWTYSKRGNAYRETGDYSREIADYTEAIRLDPQFAAVYYNRADAYCNKGEYDEAIADYTEAIRFEPDFGWVAETYRRRGIAYSLKCDHAEAQSDFAEAQSALAKAQSDFAKAESVLAKAKLPYKP